MKISRFGSGIAAVAAASLVLTACGDDNPTEEETTEPAATESEDAGTDPSAAPEDGEATGSEPAPAEGGGLSGTLPGAGASSQDAAMTAWIAGFQGVESGVTVTYSPDGSGAGREQFLAGATAFAGSDAYLDEEEQAASADVCAGTPAVSIPVYISPIAIPYNLPGVDTLNLSPEVVGGIFNQDITTWNDPAIAEDNPDVELPETDITVVNRSDESGTTENFIEYLVAAAPDAFPHEPSDAWPVEGGEGAAQTSGVIQVVGSTEGTIGYADASAVGQLSTASVGVGEEFVAYSPEAAAAVVDASEPVDTGVEGDLALDLARDTTESGAYPIVLVSYHVMCTTYDDPARAELVKAFGSYVLSAEGQDAAAAAAGSAPISDELRTRAMETVESITGG